MDGGNPTTSGNAKASDASSVPKKRRKRDVLMQNKQGGMTIKERGRTVSRVRAYKPSRSKWMQGYDKDDALGVGDPAFLLDGMDALAARELTSHGFTASGLPAAFKSGGTFALHSPGGEATFSTPVRMKGNLDTPSSIGSVPFTDDLFSPGLCDPELPISPFVHGLAQLQNGGNVHGEHYRTPSPGILRKRKSKRGVRTPASMQQSQQISQHVNAKITDSTHKALMKLCSGSPSTHMLSPSTFGDLNQTISVSPSSFLFSPPPADAGGDAAAPSGTGAAVKPSPNGKSYLNATPSHAHGKPLSLSAIKNEQFSAGKFMNLNTNLSHVHTGGIEDIAMELFSPGKLGKPTSPGISEFNTEPKNTGNASQEISNAEANALSAMMMLSPAKAMKAR